MSKENIRILTERYMNGETTCAEEQTLRRFFTSVAPGELPAEWRPLRALFAYEVSERSGVLPEDGARAATPVKRKWRSLRLDLFLTSAASAAIIFAVALTSPRQPRSYAMIDGRVYTDHSVVARQAEEALMLVSSSEEDTFSALELMR